MKEKKFALLLPLFSQRKTSSLMIGFSDEEAKKPLHYHGYFDKEVAS